MSKRGNAALPEPLETPSAVEAGIQTGLTVLASAVPVFGPALSAGLDGFASHVWAREVVTWTQELSAVVRYLLDRDGRTVGDLLEDDVFMGAVAAGSVIALQSRGEERRRMLANAMYNVGAGDEPGDPWLTESLLRLVDQVTPAHMRYLQFCVDQDRAPESPNDHLRPTISAAGLLGTGRHRETPEWRLVEIAQELETLGLVEGPIARNKVLQGMVGLEATRVSDKGRLFLKFVSGPFSVPDGEPGAVSPAAD